MRVGAVAQRISRRYVASLFRDAVDAQSQNTGFWTPCSHRSVTVKSLTGETRFSRGFRGSLGRLVDGDGGEGRVREARAVGDVDGVTTIDDVDVDSNSTEATDITTSTTPSIDIGPNLSSDPSSKRHSSSSRQQQHNTLSTYLAHATHTSLSKTSTTYLGTRYEYLIHSHFTSRLGFNLTRTGGRGDSGIDLLGTWDLPSILARQNPTSSSQHPVQPQPQPAIPILIQCKRLSRPTPTLIRELEGSFRAAPSTHRVPAGLAMMVCSAPATKGIRDAMGRTRRGVMWWFVEEVEGDAQIEDIVEVENGTGTQSERVPGTRIRQVLWNRAAGENGLEGLGVGVKYEDDVGNGVRGGNEVVFLWKGKPVDFGALGGD